MTLGQAIKRAHERGDAEERNRLMALAHSHATMRDLAALLGVGLGTAHKWIHEGNPCNPLGSAAVDCTLVQSTEKCPREAGTSGGVARKE